MLRQRPQRLIYDRAADSDPLRQRLNKRRIELICPHRRGRKRPADSGRASPSKIQTPVEDRTIDQLAV